MDFSNPFFKRPASKEPNCETAPAVEELLVSSFSTHSAQKIISKELNKVQVQEPSSNSNFKPPFGGNRKPWIIDIS